MGHRFRIRAQSPQWSSDYGVCPSPQRHTLHSLSSLKHLSCSVTASCGYPPPRHWCYSHAHPVGIAPCLQVPGINSVLNNRFLLKMALGYSNPRVGEGVWISSPMIACQAGVVTVTLYPNTPLLDLRLVKTVGLSWSWECQSAVTRAAWFTLWLSFWLPLPPGSLSPQGL
jgi:hypothetical protein